MSNYKDEECNYQTFNKTVSLYRDLDDQFTLAPGYQEIGADTKYFETY